MALLPALPTRKANNRKGDPDVQRLRILERSEWCDRHRVIAAGISVVIIGTVNTIGSTLNTITSISTQLK